MEAAVQLMADWCRAQPMPGARVEVRRLPGNTPLLLIDIPGELPGCALLYGHLDKQPEFTGWLPGLGPWEPVIREGKLYGRGAADDGYAVFSSLTAIAALKAQRVALPRCVLLIEACEESGSVDLPAHLAALGCGTRGSFARGLPGCRMRQLRASVVHHLAARQPRRQPARARAHGRACTRAWPRGSRRRRFASSSSCSARLESPINGDLLLEELHVILPKDRRAADRRRGTGARRHGGGQASLGLGRARPLQRPGGAHHQQYLESDTGGDGRRWHAAPGFRRQRAAA